jgi:hypothetical protein
MPLPGDDFKPVRQHLGAEEVFTSRAVHQNGVQQGQLGEFTPQFRTRFGRRRRFRWLVGM